MSQVSRKNSDEIRRTQPKSQKTRRTGTPEAGSGQQERRQARSDESLRDAYEYGKCNGGVSLVDRPLQSIATTPKPARRST